MNRRGVVLAMILLFLWVLPVFAQCDKSVNDNGIIQQTLEEYFGTPKVSGEPDAVVDWCYYGGWEQLFLFLMIPSESEAKAKATMKEIGGAILEKCRTHQKLGKALSPFEESALKRGFTIQMMEKGAKGVSGGSHVVCVYISPSSMP